MKQTTFDDINPIFIVGAPRSGTTLLQMLLNSHPNLAIYGEVHFFDIILSLKENLPDLSDSETIEDFFNSVNSIYNIQYLPDSEEIFARVKEKLKSEKYPSYEVFYKYLLEEYAQSQNATNYGEKTPEYIRYLKEIIQIFPKAKIIHIIRDPRDVVASLIKMPWTANDVIINTLKWKIDILYSQEFIQNCRRDYLEVCYEDLVDQSEVELRKITNFIGEEYSENMLSFYIDSKSSIKNEYWKRGTLNPINSQSVGKWKKELSESQALLIEKIVGKRFLSLFGYKPSDTNFKSIFRLPLAFLSELFNYFQYKYDETQERKDNPEVIYGSNDRFYKMFLKAITQY